MKTKITTLKLLVALCFIIISPLITSAADIYVCGTGTVKLQYLGGHTLVVGDKVVWQEVDATGAPISSVGAVPKEFLTTIDDTSYTITGTTDITTPGQHFYRAHVLTADPAQCSGDVSSSIEVYMLPAFTVELTPLTSTYCAEGLTNNTGTEVTAEAKTGTFTLPTDVSFSYDWSQTTAGAGTVGSTPNKFKMTSTTVASYIVRADAQYVVPTGKTLKHAGTTPCTEFGTTTIKVAPKPGPITITVS